MANQASELMGKMRLASSTLQAGADLADEIWQEGEVMISPLQAAELANIVQAFHEFVNRIETVVDRFSSVAESRRPTP